MEFGFLQQSMVWVGDVMMSLVWVLDCDLHGVVLSAVRAEIEEIWIG